MAFRDRLVSLRITRTAAPTIDRTENSRRFRYRFCVAAIGLLGGIPRMLGLNFAPRSFSSKSVTQASTSPRSQMIGLDYLCDSCRRSSAIYGRATAPS